MLYNPPRTQEIKDRLVKHPKDSEEEVRKRLMQYHAYVEELVDYYVDAQHMIADQDPHTVFEYLESMTVKPLPRHYWEMMKYLSVTLRKMWKADWRQTSIWSSFAFLKKRQ